MRMLERVDRIQVAVRDVERAIDIWGEVVGAEPVREDSVESLRSHRTVLHMGESEVEMLVPTGPGPVADHLGAWGEGLFAAGFSVADIGAMRQQLSDTGVRWTEEGDQIFVDGSEASGLGFVISTSAARERVGLLSTLYEVTHLVRSWKQAQDAHSRMFGLAPEGFCEIESVAYGYTGSLLLFDPPARLDRVELCQIVDPELPMGRFFRRRGEALYMCYSECDDPAKLVAHLREIGARFDAPGGQADPDNLFIHPTALTGVLMGVSRTNYGWTWSGRPELASRGAAS
jgi:hypothetical protein